jgi:hypothetical protein
MRQSTPAGPVAIHGRVTGRVSKGSNQNGVAGSGCQVRRSACLRKLNFNKNCDCREFLVWPALAAAGVVWSVSSDTENTVFERSNPPPRNNTMPPGGALSCQVVGVSQPEYMSTRRRVQPSWRFVWTARRHTPTLSAASAARSKPATVTVVRIEIKPISDVIRPRKTTIFQHAF